MPDRDDAQRRVTQVRAFQAELRALEDAGVAALTAEQRAVIGTYHDRLLTRLTLDFDVDASAAASQLSRGMQVAALVAAVALTAAIASLVSRYWGRLDQPLQATLLTLFPLAALVGVELSARRERSLYVASLFALVAYGTFWLAAGVLSWTHNIPIIPAVLWAGALFGLSLALVYGFRLVLAIALATAILAVPASVFHAAGVPWTAAIARPEPMVFTALLLTMLAPRLAQIQRGFAATTRLVGFGIGLLFLLHLSQEGAASLLPLSARVATAVHQGVMLVTCSAILVVAVRRRWRETAPLAAAMLTLFLTLRFFDWFWDWLPRYVFFLVLAAIAFGWLLALGRMRRRMARGGR